MHRLYGIETEYGIAVEGKGASDLMRESMELVRACPFPHVTGWNYRGETPRQDMRGFVADHLATNPDDAQFDEPDRRHLSMSEERSDRILANGARLYNDHGHPEYSTPECASLMDLVAHDRAGERIVWECANRRSAEIDRRIRLYKNNTDYHGASYGTHECYLMRRDLPPEPLINGLIPFLVTRQIFAGAGKVGIDGKNEPIFQLSQRADFFSVQASVDTLHNRPLVNTRDEPHATPTKYRRLHVIIGDANMSEWATAMKAGATAAVIALLESGWSPVLRLQDPVQALKEISRDQSLQWLVKHEDGGTVSALDIQRLYLNQAKKRLGGMSEAMDFTLREWELVLDALECDLMAARDRIDWIAKRDLLDQFRQAEGVGWDNPIMQSLDLAYHDLDPEFGLYAGLEAAGEMRRLVTDARIQDAMRNPPSDTRAFIRGLFIDRYPESVRSVGWNIIAFRHNSEDLRFDLNPLVEANVSVLNRELAEAADLESVVARIRGKSARPIP